MSIFTRSTLPTRESSALRRWFSILLLSPLALMLGAWSFQEGNEKVTMRERDVPLLTVFKSIKKQTGYRFYYTMDYVNDQSRVSIDVKNARVEDVLQTILGREYTWVYNENAVSISKKKLTERKSDAAPVADSVITQITVSGSVTDSKGTPIPGATVLVKGTHDGASTDEYGNFSLASVRPNAVLVISSVGFERREVAVKGRRILAQLNVSANDLDEAVVVAYNTTTQRKNVGAVTVVKGEQIETFPNRSIDRSLQGLVPGLQITSGSGLPGGAVSTMTLRGIATGGIVDASSNPRNPLIVIDGIPALQDNFNYAASPNMPAAGNPLAQINPGDIESISVLKDASAISLYGTRASNGVVLITTKKGKAGRININFRHQTDLSSRVKAKRDVLNQDQYLQLLYESYKNADATRWTDDAIKADLQSKFPTKADGSFYQSPNWFNELYSDHALTLSNDLSLSGGTEKVTYYVNLNSVKQDGVLKNTGYDRYSVRYNMTFKPVSWFNMGINSNFSYNLQDFGVRNESVTDPNGFPSFVSPLLPVKDSSHNNILYYSYGAGGSNVVNPLAILEKNINRSNAYRALGNIFAEINFLRNFSFRTNIGADLLNSDINLKVDRLLDNNPAPTPYSGRVEQGNEKRTAIVVTNTLRYGKGFGQKHELNALISQEAQTIKQNSATAIGIGYSSSYFDQISNAALYSAYGLSTKETLLSYFAQANYSYNSKYLASFSGRLDGSSKFGADVPFGKFWSIGLGWILSEESFLKPTAGWLDFLKMRGSFGIAGNTNSIPLSARYNTLQATSYPDYGTAVLQTIANPDVKGERTFNTDVGIETRLFKDRLTLTADAYTRKTSDLLYNVNEPLTTGRTSVIANIGNMENKGLELSVSVDVIRKKNFKWNLTGNWSTNSNKLTSLNNAISLNGLKLINIVGQQFNSWYLVRWAGVDPADGKPQWLDSTGKITKTYSVENRVIVGNPQPKGFGALTTTFTYKNFELVAFFYYAYGFKIYNGWLSSMINDGASDPYNNQSTLALDRWQNPGDISSNPRRVLNNQDGGNKESTRYLVDGDFIRFKNLLLAYNFSPAFLKRVKINNAKLFVQAYNIGLWTKSPAIDPDNTGNAGENIAGYPQQKSFSIGLNLSL